MSCELLTIAITVTATIFGSHKTLTYHADNCDRRTCDTLDCCTDPLANIFLEKADYLITRSLILLFFM